MKYKAHFGDVDDRLSPVDYISVTMVRRSIDEVIAWFRASSKRSYQLRRRSRSIS
nr:hypothetical protein [Sphingomonas sp. CDS-1]